MAVVAGSLAVGRGGSARRVNNKGSQEPSNGLWVGFFLYANTVIFPLRMAAAFGKVGDLAIVISTYRGSALPPLMSGFSELGGRVVPFTGLCASGFVVSDTVDIFLGNNKKGWLEFSATVTDIVSTGALATLSIAQIFLIQAAWLKSFSTVAKWVGIVCSGCKFEVQRQKSSEEGISPEKVFLARMKMAKSAIEIAAFVLAIAIPIIFGAVASLPVILAAMSLSTTLLAIAEGVYGKAIQPARLES